jgi:hypothetical protein
MPPSLISTGAINLWSATYFCQLFHWPAQFIECHTPFIFANYPIGRRNLLNATINYSTRPAQFIIECRATANIPFGWRSLLNATPPYALPFQQDCECSRIFMATTSASAIIPFSPRDA